MVGTTIHEDVRASLVAPLGRLAGLEPFQLLEDSTAFNEALLDAQHDVAALRRAAVRDLRAQGYTLREIGEPLNMTPQRVHQIEHGFDRHEQRRRKL